MKLAPIVLFVYNRPWHTQKTIESLQKNELAKDSELFIYSDEAKNENSRKNIVEVREYLNTISGFKKVTIILRDKNWGLANSIINGVTSVIEKYGKVIVLEDDLITTPCFLKYMNDCLDIFENRQDIFSITGFSYSSSIMNIPNSYNDDIYLSYRGMSWSWAVWKKQWESIDWDIKDFKKFSSNKKEIQLFNRGGADLYPMLKRQLEGELDSWAIRFCYAHYKNSAFCVYPTKSFVNNIGFDGSGVHCGNDLTGRLNNDLLNYTEININKDIPVSEAIIKEFYKVSQPGIFGRFKSLIKNLQEN